MTSNIDKAVIVPYARVEEIVKKITGKKVLVGGCFDVLHFGHVEFLKAARGAGDALIVAIEPDEFIMRKKGKQPVHTQSERAQILAAIRPVDAVVLLPLFDQDGQYLEMIERIAPTVIAVSEGDPNHGKKLKHAVAVGVTLLIVTPHIPGFSSSKAAHS